MKSYLARVTAAVFHLPPRQPVKSTPHFLPSGRSRAVSRVRLQLLPEPAAGDQELGG